MQVASHHVYRRLAAAWHSARVTTVQPALEDVACPAAMEALEGRRLFDGTVEFSLLGSHISITGTEGADTISVARVNNEHVVTLNGQRFAGGVLAKTIEIRGKGENDTITVDDSDAAS